MEFAGKTNSPFSETSMVNKAVEWLRERLPESWQIEMNSSFPGRPMDRWDERLTIRASNGANVTVAIETKQSVSPRTISSQIIPKVETARKMGANLPYLLVTDWLSERTQQLLTEEEINYIDLTGNARISSVNPTFFLQTDGAKRNPAPKQRGLPQLRGTRASRLIRTLLDVMPPYGVADLADATGLTRGYVSQLLETLYKEALIERESRGPVQEVDIEPLMRRWANSYDVFTSNVAETFIAKEGIEPTLSELAGSSSQGEQFAITGSFAARRWAPVASPSLLLVYSQNPASLAKQMNLLPTEEGADVILLRPFDPVVFSATEVENDLSYVSPAQSAVDCMTGNGRMPAEGEALVDWMLGNESTWRLPSLMDWERSGDQ